MNDLIVEIENQTDFHSKPVIGTNQTSNDEFKKPADGENVVRCSNCGAPVDADSKFCTNCGAKFEPKTKCPKCGAPIGEGDTFCTNCGNKL